MIRTAKVLSDLDRVPVLLAQAPAARDSGSAKARRERTLELYRAEAKGYTIYRDASRRDEVKLLTEPVYVWTI